MRQRVFNSPVRLLATLAIVLCAAVAASAQAPPAAAATTAAFVPASLIAQAEQRPDGNFDVIVQGSSSRTAGSLVSLQALVSPGGARGLRREFTTVRAVSAQVTGRQLLRLARLPGVAAITPDVPMRLAGGLSNRQQWPFVSGVARGWADVNNGSLAQPPAIAIVDSGIEAGRTDFGGRVIRQVDLTSRPGNSAGDGRGHGTFVAGIAAGSAAGHAGAAPSAKLVSIDVMDDTGVALTSDVIAAADWIYRNKSAYGIRVANFSLHSTAPASIFWDPLDRAVEKLWLSGVVVVAAAGNYGVDGRPSGVLYAPGNDPFVITVGANDVSGSVSTNDDAAAPWSAYGFTLDGFAKPELGAPGRYMIGPVPASSTLAAERPDSMVEPGYVELSGTSFAAPVVAGAAAYLLAKHPAWTPDQVKGALMLTAKRTPSATPLSLGVGELDAARAADVVAPPNPNLALQLYVVPDPNDPLTPAFDAAAWGSAAWGSAAWGSAAWGSAAWGSAAWGSAAWGSTYWSSAAWGTAAWGSGATETAAWGSAAWGSAAWGSAAWGTAAWGSLAIADNADGETGPRPVLDVDDIAEAEADLGITIDADGSVSTPAG
jgi:serine protease AprX